MKRYFALMMSVTALLSADSVSLFNDSMYPLKAVVYDANGVLLGEFMLNPRDASEWSDNAENFELQNAPQVPYTVNWSCTGGAPYGSCDNVAAGSLVTAQSCGGTQQCSQP